MSGIVDLLAIETGMDTNLVERIMRTAPTRYKTYQIPKRLGGFRTISQPAKEVKILQRALVRVLLSGLRVHDAATAYRDGISIRENALRHAGHGPILKMDFADFFPSIKAADWFRYCDLTGALTSPTDVQLTSRLIFHQKKGSSVLRLAIGAPSSPAVSNALLWAFDDAISNEVAKDKVMYTRYADDLTFSAPRTGYLVNVEKAVRKIIKLIDLPKLVINEGKTTRITTKYGRRVTGLTLTNDGAVSVGHKRKRELHTAVYRATKGRLEGKELADLKGMLGFVNSVEPEFIMTLRNRFGQDIIRQIQSFDIPKRQR